MRGTVSFDVNSIEIKEFNNERGIEIVIEETIDGEREYNYVNLIGKPKSIIGLLNYAIDKLEKSDKEERRMEPIQCPACGCLWHVEKFGYSITQSEYFEELENGKNILMCPCCNATDFMKRTEYKQLD